MTFEIMTATVLDLLKKNGVNTDDFYTMSVWRCGEVTCQGEYKQRLALALSKVCEMNVSDCGHVKGQVVVPIEEQAVDGETEGGTFKLVIRFVLTE